MELKYPKNFLWGAATSAHQVEGNNHNDWSEWEKENAQRLSKASGGKYPPENYISGRACDHYNRFREDFDIAKRLGYNGHRFSIEWSRIEPEEGKFDIEEIEHYREVIKALRERGLEPFATLWHSTNPIWIRDIGGWENSKTADYFARYVEKIIKSYPDVKYWLTFNEPTVYAGLGYIQGTQPPWVKSMRRGNTVFKNFVKAHRLAYQTQSIDISLKHGKWGPISALPISWRPIDDLGWAINQEGIYHLLKKTSKYGKTIFITESGIADAKDTNRPRFIKETLNWVSKAIKERIDVRGYFHWAFMDNFEIPELRGFWPRFGLIAIDYKTLERKIRPSAYKFKEIIESQK